LTPGICGFTHGFEGQMMVKIETSFDPQWGSVWFGLMQPSGNPVGLFNTFSSSGWKAATSTLLGSPISFYLPRNDVYWMRIKDGSVDYSSDGEIWYSQTKASGDQVFLGCWNGGAFWVEMVQ
jgi:hypothetical protein